jgi:hypothetical protein
MVERAINTREAEQLPPCHLLPNPTRVPAQIEHGHHSRLLLRLKVIDAKWKPAGQHPETVELPLMNSMMARGSQRGR